MERTQITDNIILKSNMKGLNAIVDEETGEELVISSKDYKKMKEMVNGKWKNQSKELKRRERIEQPKKQKMKYM